MRLGDEAAAEPAAADGGDDADIDKAEEGPAADCFRELTGAGDDRGQFGEVLGRRRWKPWQLEQDAAAAAAAETAAADVDQDAAGAAAAASAGGLDSQELQAWRQGVLGLWKQPYLSVKLELLPLEQQQDPAALSRLPKAKKGPSAADGGSDSGQGIVVVRDSFGQAPSLLLLGRIVG
jgi:hypothetical protein